MKKRLLIDLGNSSTHSGFIAEEEIIDFKEELGFNFTSIDVKPILKNEVQVVFTSVNLGASEKLNSYFLKYGIIPKEINIRNQNVVTNTYETLGIDRVCDLAGGLSFQKNRDILVFNFGTATTASLCNSKGEFSGGLIKAGLGLELKALSQHTSQLPELNPNDFKAITMRSKNTNENILCGVLLGQIGMMDQYISLVFKELSIKPFTIITGGFSNLISSHYKNYDLCEPRLSILGLKHLSDHSVI